MKTAILCLTLLLTMNACEQSKNNFVVFKTTQFETINPDLKIKFDTIIWKSTFDIVFFRKTFYMPYYIPSKFIDPKYKSEKVVFWNDSTAKKDFNSNWSYTDTYDSLTRVIEFDYSGCMICNQIPYNWFIYYDDRSRPVRLEGGLFPSQNKNSIDEKDKHDEYILKFDNDNNVIQLQYFRHGKLIEQIEKI